MNKLKLSATVSKRENVHCIFVESGEENEPSDYTKLNICLNISDPYFSCGWTNLIPTKPWTNHGVPWDPRKPKNLPLLLCSKNRLVRVSGIWPKHDIWKAQREQLRQTKIFWKACCAPRASPNVLSFPLSRSSVALSASPYNKLLKSRRWFRVMKPIAIVNSVLHIAANHWPLYLLYFVINVSQR